MTRLPSLGLAAAAFVLAAAPLVAEGYDPFLQTLSAEQLEKAPAQRYARLSREEALAELRARGAIFDEVPADKAPGVLAPVRLTSRLGGVHIHGTLSPEASVSSPFEILDARLALSLHDFAAILSRHDIDEIVHFSMFRPGLAGYSTLGARRAPSGVLPAPGGASPLASTRPRASAARPGKARAARHAEPPAPRLSPPTPSEGQTTSRHPAALAIDVGAFKKKTGEVLSVASAFQGHIGQRTCGEGAPEPKTSEARELRSIVCEAADLRLFTYVLSPNFNAAHRDHLHMEIKSGVSWMLIH